MKKSEDDAESRSQDNPEADDTGDRVSLKDEGAVAMALQMTVPTRTWRPSSNPAVYWMLPIPPSRKPNGKSL